MDAARRKEILSRYQARTTRFAEIAEDRERRLCQRVLALAPEQDEPRALTSRELEVLKLVADGLTSKEVGRKLFVAEETVRSHVANIFAALGARNRAHAVTLGFRRGILDAAAVSQRMR